MNVIEAVWSKLLFIGHAYRPMVFTGIQTILQANALTTKV